ncbi:HAMP domain-containing sensor histidine kinase [Parablautia intestinalis]|uniref:HAMP domain-containing sensor histidine kinase n=1 Tax=Parablautia intestinalis TaxID=2320100 RepID=UPI00256EED80|nr:HAMP domain-containing sensor histidine kinase [Parablautia intestinalis]
MKKKIRNSLFVKIFAVTCLLMVVCCAATYGFIAWLVPQTYSTDLDAALDKEANVLISELECTAGAESGVLFDEFLLNNTVLLQLYDEKGREIALPSQYNNDFPDAVHDGIVFEGEPSLYGATHSYLFRFEDSETVYTLSVAGNAEPVSQLTDTIGSIVPSLMVMAVFLSVIGAVLYSRYVTKPVIEISRVSEKMSGLDFTWDCTEERSDELGILAHSLNELSRKLSSSLNDLQEANSRLEADIERERMLEQAQLDFFSAVSHELKTPITVIKGQLEGMLLNVGKYKERDKYLARSLEVVKAMEGMVQEILTVSRIKSSENTLQEETFDFSDLVKSAHGLFEDMVVGKGLEWHEELQKGLMLQGDKALLGKVVNNLFSNAIHYSPAGSDIFITAHSQNERIQFSIENTGVHLPEGDIPKLFDAFYRVERSRSRQTGGSGLGLYIVKMILEQHGADYQIRNTEQGVCFRIDF